MGEIFISQTTPGLLTRGGRIWEYAADIDSSPETGNAVILVHGGIYCSMQNRSRRFDEPIAPVALTRSVQAAANDYGAIRTGQVLRRRGQ